MIIDFTVENFLSFKEVQTLSFVADNSCKEHEEHLLDAPFTDIKLLKSVIIYGANASGKSNLLVALHYLKELVLNSINHKPNEKLGILPFLLNKNNRAMPTGFELNFFHNKIRYSYRVLLDNDKIHYECLYYFPKKYKKNIFIRHLNETGSYNYSLGDDIKPKKLYEDVALKTSENILFLSKAVQENNLFLKQIYDWFENHLSPQKNMLNAFKMIDTNTNYKEQLIKYLHSQDIGIVDVAVKKMRMAERIIQDNPQFPEEIKQQILEDFKDKTGYELNTLHKDADGEPIAFELKFESEGTKKLFTLFDFLFQDEQNLPKTFYVDELSSDLHPLLVKNFFKLFHHKTNNQMLCITHDTHLLDADIFRKDQINFIEKDETEASSVYSLAEFQPRKDRENWQARYLTGRYGAIPFVEKMIP